MFIRVTEQFVTLSFFLMFITSQLFKMPKLLEIIFFPNPHKASIHLKKGVLILDTRYMHEEFLPLEIEIFKDLCIIALNEKI